MEEHIVKLQGYAIDFGVKLLTAAAIFLIGKWVARLITVLIEQSMAKSKCSPTLISFTKTMAYFGLLIFVTIAALSQLGIQTTSFIALIGAAGLAIGLAFQSSLSNLASGFLLIMFAPFEVGDTIEAAGSIGLVMEIQIFNTVLKDNNGKIIIIPNGKITSDKIIVQKGK